jgi:hypothetical protein
LPLPPFEARYFFKNLSQSTNCVFGQPAADAGKLASFWEARKAHLIVFHNCEMPHPIGSTLQCSDNNAHGMLDRRRRNPEQDNAARSWQSCPKSEFAKVLVEGEEQAIFGLSAGQHFRVGDPRRVSADPGDVVTTLAEGGDRISGKVLIG